MSNPTSKRFEHSMLIDRHTDKYTTETQEFSVDAMIFFISFLPEGFKDLINRSEIS